MIRQHTIISIRKSDGEVSITIPTGETGDISFLSEFEWHDVVWVSILQSRSESMENKRLGQHCGPSINCGDTMSASTLGESGNFVHRTSMFPIKEEERSADAFKERDVITISLFA